MTGLARNLTPFYYCNYSGKTPVVDEEGFETGETAITYTEPVKLMGNISPAKGESQIEQFGTSLEYDKVIIVFDPDCAITETSVLFVDKQPTFGDDETTPLYDYIVKRVARSLNYTALAVSRVDVS